MQVGPKESITNLLLSFYLIWMVTVTANSQTLLITVMVTQSQLPITVTCYCPSHTMVTIIITSQPLKSEPKTPF